MKFLVLMLVAFASTAQAAKFKEDPRFTKKMAVQMFKKGHVPTVQEVTGPWVARAWATDYGRNEGVFSLYTPDGKYLTSNDELARFTLQITELESFPSGKPRIKYEEIFENLDTGKTSSKSFVVRPTEKAFKFVIWDPPGGCTVTQGCVITEDAGLLCRYVITHSACLENNVAYSWTYFVR